MNTPADLKYTTSDEWVRQEEDGTFTVGITHYAQDALGEIVYAELFPLGQSVAPGEHLGVVESVKAVGDLQTPVGGEIVATNETALQNPDLLNSSPYEEGWLLRIKPSSPPDLSGLMDAEAYAAYRG